MDKYIACGITSDRSAKFYSTRLGIRRSHMISAIVKYGKKNFVRQNVMYFNSRDDLIEAETQIVNYELIQKENTYNVSIGGKTPPRNVGSDNGNFQNFWTDEQKTKLSNYFKENRDTKGNKNSRAVICRLVDITDNSFKEFSFIGEAAESLGLKANTGRTFINKPRLLKKKYILIKQDFKGDLNKLIEQAKNYSRWY